MPTPVVVTEESGTGGSAVPTDDTGPIEVDDSGTLPTCTPERLDTRTAGELSVGAAAGVGAPWLSASGGLDRSVVTEVAATLGFAPDDVHWAQVPAPPGQAVADVDLAVGTFVIPDDPSNASADHSSGYLDLAQVVLVRRGSTAPATLDGVMTGTVAAVSGTPGFAAATGLGAIRDCCARRRRGRGRPAGRHRRLRRGRPGISGTAGRRWHRHVSSAGCPAGWSSRSSSGWCCPPDRR